ncbi:MAG TPA: NAD-dependent epimerase/dehydratase family protein [bacterium]|nr:NAD-dependent epimerase/dehydratase family protein [bacterium]
MTTLLITGADGFVGRPLCALALQRGFAVRGAVRALPSDATQLAGLEAVTWLACGDLAAKPDWSEALAGADAVIHLAGRAHVLQESAANAVAMTRCVNVEGTQRLAEAMLAGATRRIVYVSSAHVHGRETDGAPIDERSPPCPQNAYARSKWDAEEALRALIPSGLELVVVRPVLIYGPGAKGNLRRLMHWVARGWPLPLAGIRNARSLLALDSLCELLLACATRPDAAGETFVAADAEALSTPELVRVLAGAMGRPVRLWRAPQFLLRAALWLAGRLRTWEQLTGSLVVDAARSRAWLGQSQAPDPRLGLAEMARAFLREQGGA